MFYKYSDALVTTLVTSMYDLSGKDVASSVYYGLFALQHRGQ